MNKSQIEIYKSADNQTQVAVKFEAETVWLNRQQLSFLFDRDIKTIGKHINNVFNEGELDKKATVAKFAIVQTEGSRKVERNIEHYNLDVIISVGYRVKSQRGTQFRQWATQRLKDHLIQGYSINQQRLEQKQQEVLYLKSGIQILNRALEEEIRTKDLNALKIFSKGLQLLDDYDHQKLQNKGTTEIDAIYPDYDDYMKFIKRMYSHFESGLFAKPKDDSFHSSINQVKQTFDGKELYPTIQEKVATLLYLVVKNHSFVDGNKRIAAACFLYFLERNDLLLDKKNEPIISNEALAALTLFIAMSKSDEMEVVKSFIISILNERIK